MSDDPFDFDAEERPANRPAPGRRAPVRSSSRARTGGSAQPIGATSQNRPPTPRRVPPAGERPRTIQPGAAPTSEPPQSVPPASHRPRTTSAPQRPATNQPGRQTPGQATPSGTARTRVMPTAQARQVSASSRTAQPASTRPPDAPTQQPRAPRRKRRRGRIIVLCLVVLLVLVLAWPVGLMIWANGKINTTQALSGAAATPGTTYLLAGSDSRADGALSNDTTEGQRADTIMLLTVPPSGTSSLISLPRDTYVDIPTHGPGKLNTAYAVGGAPLLVQTVEALTGITIDHYVEIGMGGVQGLVDAVGGVELCLDYVVDDPDSGLVWPEPGCRVVDGTTALAFARMRKADPLGDIGRTQRQQQVIAAVTQVVADPGLIGRPSDQVRLIDAGLGALTVSEGTNIIDMGQLALAFREATGPDGVRGTPPIVNLDYRPGGLGSTVLLDADLTPGFFQSVADGTITDADLGDIG